MRFAFTVCGCQIDALSSVSVVKERSAIFVEPIVTQASSTSMKTVGADSLPDRGRRHQHAWTPQSDITQSGWPVCYKFLGFPT